MKPVARVVPFLSSCIAGLLLSCEVPQATSPRPALSLDKTADKTATGAANACLADRDHDKKTAPVAMLCAITVPGNPLTNVAKG